MTPRIPSVRLLFTALALATAPSFARAAGDPFPLWPEGKAPHANAKDAETGKPKLFPYLVPKDKANGCAVVVTPGGGYGGLAADHEGHQIALWWNERGVSAFVLHYRLGPEGHHFPTQLADVQRAIRTVRARAGDYGIDPRRIGVMGFSAGGHLASMASTKFHEQAYEATDAIDAASARPDFSVLCYPVIAMASEFAHGGSRKNLLGGDFAPDSPEAKHVSSDGNVTAETPPTFLFQTDEDTVVPAENAVRYYLALRKHKIPAEMHIYQRGPHGVGLYLGDPITGTWSGLLDTWMRSNGFYAPAAPRVAVAGEVTLNGNPVRWGSVTFHPAAGAALPVVTARVMGGKFSLPAEMGPVVGGHRLTFSASTWETTQNDADRVVQADRLSPKDPGPATIEVKAGLAPLKFALQSR